MSTTFIDVLRESHMRNYTGSDDNAPDAFDSWIEDLEDSELVQEFQLYIDKYPASVVAKELYNLIS